jgi:hypothetical protein
MTKRTAKFLKRIMRNSFWYAGIVLLAVMALTIAGCYESDVEVISASTAVAVYGVPGDYTFDNGGTLTVSAVPLSNDFRFREVSKNNKVSTGYLRLVPLRGDIYIIQAKYDNETVYFIDFYQFNASTRRFQPLEVSADEKSLNQLAQQYKVKIDWESYDFVPYLTGTSGNILAFLKAHANLPFKPASSK